VSDDAMAGPPAHVSDLPVWQRLGLGVLAEYVPTEVIDDVLAQTGRVQLRIRRLPARVSVLFILGLSLFGGMGYRGVWRELTHSGGVAAGPAPSSSALSRARRRIGVAPKPLCLSSSDHGGSWYERGVNDLEQVAGQIPLETPHDLALGAAFCRAPCEVGAGTRLVAEPGHDDAEQCGVGLAVAAAVEAVSGGLAGGHFDWADSA
jgi:Insertion element 4 transposase N-terminal